MNQGMPQRGFAPIPGMQPPAPTAAPAAPPAPGQPGPDGSTDLLAYGRANGIAAPGANFDQTANHPGGVNMLAWGPDNGMPRPGAVSGMTPAMAPQVAAQPPPPPQTERANPLGGDVSSVMPGQSAPFTPPPAPGFANMSPIARIPPITNQPMQPWQPSPSASYGGAQPNPATHVGGEGSYMRSFTNPHSAGMYDSYVKGLFGSKPSPQRTPLTRAPAPMSYAGD